MSGEVLRIGGNVATPRTLDFRALAALDEQLLEPAPLGSQPIAAVPLPVLLRLCGMAPSTRSIVAESADGAFAVTLQLASAETCVVAYRIGTVPFPRALGGPFRLVTRGRVRTGDVKSLGMIYASEEPAFDIGDSEVICLRAPRAG
jgi:DMSO/TMAO reductase YedYZ molybdopterin-dependent catalytic subunit